jgi:uncharacterized membrane protein
MKKINYYFVIGLLSFFGFLVASYLSYKACLIRFFEVENKTSFCDITQSFSCSDVLHSPYSQIFGVSFPWVAFFVYPILFGLTYLGYKTKSTLYIKWLQGLSLGGILFNFFIIYREMFYIYSFCILCLICTAIIISIFALSSLILKEEK